MRWESWLLPLILTTHQILTPASSELRGNSWLMKMSPALRATFKSRYGPSTFLRVVLYLFDRVHLGLCYGLSGVHTCVGLYHATLGGDLGVKSYSPPFTHVITWGCINIVPTPSLDVYYMHTYYTQYIIYMYITYVITYIYIHVYMDLYLIAGVFYTYMDFCLVVGVFYLYVFVGVFCSGSEERAGVEAALVHH